MKPTLAKIMVRIVGAVEGLLGLGMFFLSLSLSYQAIGERDLGSVVFAAFMLILGGYLGYVAYLVWFRFSPLAVRHICGVLGFNVLMLVTKLFDPSRGGDEPWMTFAFLGCLVVVYIAYRVASDRLSRLFFPESVAGVRS